MTNVSADDNAVTAIVAGCRAGDRGAQRQLYDAFHRQVYRLMVRMVGLDEAADLTQQVFLHIFRQIEKYSGRGRFDRWLYRVATNEANQHLRRSKRRRSSPLAHDPVDSAMGGDEKHRSA